MTTNRFQADFARVLDLSRPVALSRFHDGELRLLRGEPYKARSGWSISQESWLRPRLEKALRAELDDYLVGISPPCDFPQGTAFYLSHVRPNRRTFATLFWHANYHQFVAALQGPLKGACIVTSGRGHYQVPANGVATRWDLDGLVTQLLEERRPILVAAGPCACVIVHEYWCRQRPELRQPILDVGAAVDPVVHGKSTRDFHDPASILRNHSCSWDQCVPWASEKMQNKKGAAKRGSWFRASPQTFASRPVESAAPSTVISRTTDEAKARKRWTEMYRRRRDARKGQVSQRGPKPAVRPTRTPKVPTSNKALAPLSLADDLITVSMPYYNAGARLLVRALTSVLEQEHRHVRVLVTGDGVALPRNAELERLLSDPRVVKLQTSKNWGPYFHHEVASQAAFGPFLAVQDADDESCPARFKAQLQRCILAGADVCLSPVFDVRDGRTVVSPVKTPSRTFSHRAEHFGTWNNASVRALGGYYGGYRIGLDTLMTGAVLLLGKPTWTQEPLYRRTSRTGSLSRAPATGHGSAARETVKSELRTLYSQVAAAKSAASGTGILRAAMRGGQAPHASELSDLVATAKAKLKSQRIDPPPASTVLVEAVMNAAPPSTWAIHAPLALHLYRTCERLRPKVILDVGSGMSTMVLALYASRYGATLVSLEHDQDWLAATRRALEAAGLAHAVRLTHAKIQNYGDYSWYSFDPSETLNSSTLDLVFVDGPPEGLGHGRHGVVNRCLSHVRAGTHIWLHDGERPGEREAVARWRTQLHFTERLNRKHDTRGVWELEVTGVR